MVAPHRGIVLRIDNLLPFLYPALRIVCIQLIAQIFSWERVERLHRPFPVWAIKIYWNKIAIRTNMNNRVEYGQ